MAWTDEDIETLTKLWNEGRTTAEIGQVLGKTKNAVVGKAHRLQLAGRPSPIKRGSEEESTPPTDEAVAETQGTSESSDPEPLQVVPPRARVQLAARPKGGQCQWPIGHPDEPDFHFCLKPIVPGKPYCAEHCAVAYIPPTRKGELRSQPGAKPQAPAQKPTGE